MAIYQLIAMPSSGSGGLLNYIINRIDGTIVNVPMGSATCTCSYSSGVLTVTLPSTAYWNYSFTEIHREN